MQQDSLLKARIIDNAKQCVKCGLCAPHCPTYCLSMNENESGRGRISLMDGIAKDEIPLTETTLKHLDHCLTCRACEAACPSEVKYGELIDDTRQYLADKRPPPQILQQLGWIMAKPGRLRSVQLALYCLQKTGILWLIKQTRIAKLFNRQRLLEFLPKLCTPWWFKRTTYPAYSVLGRPDQGLHLNPGQEQRQNQGQGQSRGRIGLFLGCINQWSDKPVYEASIRVLNALGYDVVVPPQQTCCGAIWQHAGLRDTFKQCQNSNHQAFNSASSSLCGSDAAAAANDSNPTAPTDINGPLDAIVSIASGCTATLREYEAATALPAAQEICTFLAQELKKNPLKFKPLDQKIAIHSPCSQRNVLKSSRSAYDCLQHIPELKLIALTDKTHCCGAAGLNMLQYPETADPLVAQTLSQLLDIKAETICTTNIGCHLHFQRYLRQNGHNVKIKHPVILLAEQLM